ncbi:MAG TPA: hypothetical protein VGX23_34240 [Actinocrinis sp.]|nr:hypothetical protein [Actinocrinis sp.]
MQKNSQTTRLQVSSSRDPGLVSANSAQSATARQAGCSRSSIPTAHAGCSVAASASRRARVDVV